MKYQAPCGELILGVWGDELCMCDWSVGGLPRDVVAHRLSRGLHTSIAAAYGGGICEVAARQLDEYFAGKRQEFDVPLRFVGSDFQRRVWQELMNIRYGATLSYRELAHRVGMPHAVRAVANAIGANALSVFVPCHRIVGADGSLTGYAGGLEVKWFLLDLEGER